MTFSVLGFVALWFVVSIPFSLFVGALLSQRDESRGNTRPQRELEAAVITKPGKQGYEVI